MAGAWMLISFVLATIYRSNLKAMLILPYINLPFNSVEELVQTDILCYVLEESAAEPGTAVNKLQKQLVIHGDDVRAARDFHQGKMAAISSTFTLWTLTVYGSMATFTRGTIDRCSSFFSFLFIAT
ncbi:hypothetical protein E2C01_101863 [Portunus trituberculatus]|uniref:Ionotropic glutamate receptor C-terminal domain-containing protein n=1 Tax=Portunus trituberculatus TaxID=210409 RepID=A0A5B7KFW8_PORTR|nr:hypothetical protein [Portunus trituberculatus]